MRIGIVALAIVVVSLVVQPVWADPVPIGMHEYTSNYSDIHRPPPINGIASFDGTKFVDPGVGVPIDTLSFSIEPDLSVDFTDVVFSIDLGLAELTTYVIDNDGSLTINAGDLIYSAMSAGSFSFTKGGQLLMGGTFSGATFTAFWGDSTGVLATGDAGGLDLYPGPAFVFENGTYVADILDVESLSISLVGVPGAGITTSAPTSTPAPGIFKADMLAFGKANGSVNTFGQLYVIPEPSSFALAAIGLVALVGVARRRRNARRA